jgi:hypothetical protein
MKNTARPIRSHMAAAAADRDEEHREADQEPYGGDGVDHVGGKISGGPAPGAAVRGSYIRASEPSHESALSL